MGIKSGGIQKQLFTKKALQTARTRDTMISLTSRSKSMKGPGDGQIDARDMITIKNRIKMSDARSKIVQKQMNKGTFDARSKLKSGKHQMTNVTMQIQNKNFQQNLQRPPQPLMAQVRLITIHYFVINIQLNISIWEYIRSI